MDYSEEDKIYAFCHLSPEDRNKPVGWLFMNYRLTNKKNQCDKYN